MLPDRVSNPGPLTYESGVLFCENLTDSQDAIKQKKVVLHIDSELSIKFIV